MTSEKNIDFQIISDLLGAINSISLYSDRHPQVIEFVTRFMAHFTKFIDSNDTLIIGIYNDSIIINQKPLVGAGKVADSFVNKLNKKNIEQLIFSVGLNQDELIQFIIDVMLQRTNKISPHPHIQIGTIDLGDSDLTASSPLDLISAQNFISMLGGVENNRPIVFEEVRNLSNELVKTFNQSLNPLKYLANIKTEDEYTYIHTINVALLSMNFASYIGYSGNQLLDIIFAALMHDVGKMLIPKEILNKPGSLTESEFEIMRSHTIKGVQYLSSQDDMPNIALLGALEHHIKYNGTGYPTIAPNWKPHIASQIISITDIYDALRSLRPYRQPIDHEKIIVILRNDAGVGLNPELVEHFINMLSSK